MTRGVGLVFRVAAIVLAIAAALFAANSTSFQRDNRAVYQNF
jgi:hypothetical protein